MKGSMERRARLLFGMLLLLLAGLVARAGHIQLVLGDEFAERARRQHFARIKMPAPRGRILDREGRPLAVSYHARSIAADPQLVDDEGSFAAHLAFLLGEPEAAPLFARRLAERRAAGKRFVYLRRRVDRDLARSVEAARLPGLDVREEPRREYPHGAAGAAVIGVVGADADGRIAGLTGLELLFDGALRGEDGECSVFRSGRRVPLHLYPDRTRAPRRGADLLTTLDIVLQQVVEDGLDAMMERHRPRRACAVALDPRSGEILALGCRPALRREEFPKVDRDSLKILAAHFNYEPGSTMKPLVMAWALSRGAVAPGQVIDCGPGWKRFGGRVLHDVRGNGPLALENVLVRSSNIGMAQVGQAVGIDDMERFLRALGFGRATGVQVSGEETGYLTARPEWRVNHTLVSVSFGHEMMVTPLQLACAFASLLNGGFLHTPTLVRGAARPAPRRIPYTPEALRFVRRALRRVVAEPYGTGRRARVAGLSIGGKTGTSEKYPEGSGRYVSSFVGFAPAENPRLLVLLVADEPQKHNGIRPYGGVVAAPVVGEILRRGLPLLHPIESATPPESGVRHSVQLSVRQGKVRVAAVQRSSVWDGERASPPVGRNPDSVGVRSRRGDGR